MLNFANDDFMDCGTDQTGTGHTGPCRPGDSKSRGTEFMVGMMMNNEIFGEKSKVIAAFKEIHRYLFDCYDDWIKEDHILDAETSYYIAVKMLEKHNIFSVDEDCLNGFLESIYEETDRKGIFLSAMINTSYMDRRISICPEGQKISYLGMNNEGMEIYVWGWLHDFTGMNMKDGSMEITQGITGTNIGEGMEGGEISISGAHGYEVNTDTQLSPNIKGGKIYYNDERVWPKKTVWESVKNWFHELW